jgi:glycerol-3-phosphate dehydrogenase
MSASQSVEGNWDLVIVGGGITGAGLLREAVRNGLRALLLEQRDFAWGTSSRSTKMIHGGLRYLQQGRVFLTRDAVVHRERLLREAPGLVTPFNLVLPIYQSRKPSKTLIRLGLTLYDILSGKLQHRYLRPDELAPLIPGLAKTGLQGGFYYGDAQVDDAGLVQRLLNASRAAGGAALNYTRVTGVLRDSGGRVTGVETADTDSGERGEIVAGCVINATGVWAEQLHRSPDATVHVRPLRGSHILFPESVIKVPTALSAFHPEDGRSFLVLPWNGVTLVGTTDLDHRPSLAEEPAITGEEVRYLLAALNHYFPDSSVTATDGLASFAGVRPVLSKGQDIAPSKESREHAVWVDRGLVTVTGGKLTTFRRLAWDALTAGIDCLPIDKLRGQDEPIFSPAPGLPADRADLSEETWVRLVGRYGAVADDIVKGQGPEMLQAIPGTETLWAELPFAAAREQVRHLDDLLLRRTRIGLVTEQGAEAHLDRVQEICEPVLSWDKAGWKRERERYRDLWQRCYALPVGNHGK